MIYCKRVYDPVSPEDGYRVLIDRLWPRGIKKTDLQYDEWNKAVAPSNELRKWFHQHTDRFEEFVERYHQELDQNADAWKALVKKIQQGNLTLLYSAKDREHNQARVLQSYLENSILVIL